MLLTPLSAGQKAWTSSAFLVLGEVALWVSAVVLGRKASSTSSSPERASPRNTPASSATISVSSSPCSTRSPASTSRSTGASIRTVPPSKGGAGAHLLLRSILPPALQNPSTALNTLSATA
ncbi:MAG: hypothetical protein ACR2FR_00610 [Rubrobacter sp.]